MPIRDGHYEDLSNRANARNLRASRTSRDISPCPDIVDLKRRARCLSSLKTYLETYFPATFTLAWSEDHDRVIEKLEVAIDEGGQLAVAMPRGSGKTSMLERAALQAVLKGKRRFVVLVLANEGLSGQSLGRTKAELEFNDLLNEDFPKVCYPIRKLEGQAKRCVGQLYEQNRTLITWARNRIVLPTMPPPFNEASGAVIHVCGIGASLRGLLHVDAEGRAFRPDLVLVDDPQDRESARSITQTSERLAILNGDLLGLAGPGKKIAALCACTVVAPNDLADQLLDPQRSPAWQGERCKMVYEWPQRSDLWEEYGLIRAESLREGRRGQDATQFYESHREEMDAGSRVGWPERFEPDELSALQHAFNLRFDRGEAAFGAEYQNEPPDLSPELSALDPVEIASRCSGFQRGVAPPEVEKLTAFIDVGASVLWWMVCGWSEEFSGQIIDYGAWPEQNSRVFLSRNVSPTLEGYYPSTGNAEGAIFAGLAELISKLCGKEWRRSDGASMRISRMPIDSGWQTKVVRLVTRQHEYRDLLIPSKGVGIGPSQAAISDYHKKPGEKIGDAWILGRAGPDRLRLLRYDTNLWKTRVAGMLTRARGTSGGIELFGDRPIDHEMIASHLSSEYPNRETSETKGTSATVWSRRPDRENHWFDCLVGCAVAASVEGLSPLASLGIRREEPRQRVSFRELQRRKQAERSASEEAASGRERVSFRDLQNRARENRP